MGKVTSNKVVQDNIFSNLQKSAKMAKTEVIQLSTELQKQLKVQSKIAKGTKANAKGFKELAAAERKSKQALTEKERVDQRILKLQKQQTSVSKAQRNQEAALRVEMQRRNKVAKEQALQANKNIGAFQKLNLTIRKLSTQYKNIIAKEGTETKTAKALRMEIQRLTAVRNKANVALGNHQAFVGKYSNAIKGLIRQLGQLGLAFGVFSLIRGTVSIIADFDSAMTDLAAITGKTAEEIEPLKKQALELGATTQNTAAEIAMLQTELAKLGFTTDEIMASTGPIQKFALAVGAEIPEASQLAGAALRAFQLDASEMERVVSVLAVATTKTGLDFNFLNTAMSTIAPVANAFNFSIEDTTALLGQLANSGFDASSAATATRNILLNLADANGKLAQELGRPIESADDLAAGLIELQEKGVDLAEALELTDKRSVAAFQTFLNGSKDLVELRDSITDVSGELDTMADKKLDSIAGATDLLRSAWEGLILEWNEGAGIGEGIKNVLVFLAKNLKTIIGVVKMGVTAWVTYRVAMKLYRIEVDATGKRIAVGLIPSIKNAGKAALASAKSFRFSAKGVKAFAASLKTIPFAAVLSFLVTLGPLIWDFVSGLFEGAEASTALGKATEEINKQMADENAEMSVLFEQLKQTNAGSKRRAELIDEINEKYGTTLKNLDDEAEFAKQVQIAYAMVNKELERKITMQVMEESLKNLIKQQIELKKQLAEFEDPNFLTSVFATTQGFTLETRGNLERQLLDLEKQKQEILDTINAVDVSTLGGIGGTGIAPTTGTEEGGTGTGTKKAIDAEKEKLDKLNEFRKKQALELLEMENAMIAAGDDREFIDMQLNERRSEMYREEGQFIVDLAFKTNEELIKLNNKRLKFEEENSMERIDFTQNEEEEIISSVENVNRVVKEQINIWAEVKDSVAETFKFIEEFYQRNIELIEEAQQKEQEKYDASKQREQELKDIAREKGLNADESIKAEREAQKKALDEQRKLEEKKQKIEALLSALQLLQNGESIANIKNKITDIKGFIEGQFYEGTPYTIADALGRTGTRDGHIVAIDDNESVFTGKQTRELGIGKGGNSTQDIVDIYKSVMNGTTGEFLPLIAEKDDSRLIAKVDQLTNIVAKQKRDYSKATFEAFTGVLSFEKRNGNRLEKINFPIRRK